MIVYSLNQFNTVVGFYIIIQSSQSSINADLENRSVHLLIRCGENTALSLAVGLAASHESITANS